MKYKAIIIGVIALAISNLKVNSQINSTENGYVKIMYPNGVVSSEGTMKNGEPDGYWKTFYPSGVIRSEGNRKNHLLDSTWIFYNEKGDTIQKINYVVGKRNGYTINYNTDEGKNPLEKGRIIAMELYVNDLKEGKATYFFNDGKLREDATYNQNKKNGISKEFDEAGNIITIQIFNKGILVDREKINRVNSTGEKQGVWKEFYENGKLKSEGNYQDGLLNGPYKEYDQSGNIKVILQYNKGLLVENVDTTDIEIQIRNEYDEDGNLKYSGSYKNNIPIGIHRMYDKNGKVINSILYDNIGTKIGEGIITNEGKKEGDWKYFYDDGSIKSSGKFVNNEETGKWNYYLPKSNRIIETGSFKNGKPDGLWTWYYYEDKVGREEEYYNGKEEGQSTEYDTTGQVITKGNYFDGQKEGEWNYKVGDYSEIGKYVGGLKDGKWQAFYADGTLMYEGNYIQGNPDGEHKFFYPDGKLKEEEYYSMGISEKSWKKYKENGDLVITITYKDGKEFRINGQKIEFEGSDIKLIQ